MEKIAISVIIPVYNAEKFLRACLASMQVQSFPYFEVWLVNDGSTDGSACVCDEFAEKDSRFHVVHTSNKGVSAARNKGLEMAKGDWVNFVDSDDTVDKDYLLHLYQAIEGDENDKLIFQGFKMVVSDKDIIYRTFKKHRYGLDDMYLVFQELKMNRSGYPFAKLYSNRIIKANQIRFIEEIHYAEDVMFMLTYMCHIAQVQTVEGANYNYYIRKNANTLSQRIFSFESEYTCYQTYLSRIRVIKERFALPEKSLASVYGVITEYLVRRSIGGLYQKQTRKPKKERLRILKEFTEEQIRFLKAHANFCPWPHRVTIFLLVNHFYYLCDSYSLFIAFVRTIKK